jgi:hypothetical protein
MESVEALVQKLDLAVQDFGKAVTAATGQLGISPAGLSGHQA